MLTNDKRELLVCVFTRRSACNVLSLCVKKNAIVGWLHVCTCDGCNSFYFQVLFFFSD